MVSPTQTLGSFTGEETQVFYPCWFRAELIVDAQEIFSESMSKLMKEYRNAFSYLKHVCQRWTA